MKISLIHGEDVAVSRNMFLSLVEKAKGEGFQVKDISLNTNLNLEEKLTSQSLFEDKIFFIHDKLKNLTPADLKWLVKNSKKYEGELVLWYEGVAPLKIVKALPKGAEVKKFDLPKIIFNFLDSFYPGNSVNILGLLDKLLAKEPVEFVFFMLGRHLRDLYWVKNDTAIVPDYQEWRIRKIRSQADRFSNERLKKVINFLSEADVRAKTSDSSLKEFLDLVIVTQLK